MLRVFRLRFLQLDTPIRRIIQSYHSLHSGLGYTNSSGMYCGAFVLIDVCWVYADDFVHVSSGEFPGHGDAERAWEDFFCVSKGNLSVSEIAKIRDKVGFTGMAGT